MVTAEFAIGLLAVVPVMLSLVVLTAATAGQVKAVEAARTAARVLARGQPEDDARRIVEEVLPLAQVDIARDQDRVEVVVRHTVGGFGVLPAFTLGGTAVTVLESPDGP